MRPVRLATRLACGQIAAQSLNFHPVGTGAGAGFGCRGAGGSFSFDRVVIALLRSCPSTGDVPVVLVAI